MKGFALDENGDILIVNNEIQMVTGTDLTVQTVKTVLSTNKGEWTFNEDEGVDFKNILGTKHVKHESSENAAYIHKINKLNSELQGYRNSGAEELNKLLEKRLDGES